MKRFLLFCFACLLNLGSAWADGDIAGFWKSIDDETHKPQSIIAVYEYQGKYYGRIILTYDDNGHVQDTIYDAKERAPGVVGNPPYAGLDIIWNLKPKGTHFTDGEILDPEHGKKYGAELWVDGGNLIVRGKLFFFGRNQTWLAASESDFPPGFNKPDLAALVPTIPRVIR